MFVKRGVVLPVWNDTLFVPLLVLMAALVVAPLLDTDTITRVDPATTAYRVLVRAIKSDLKHMLLAVGACLLGAVGSGLPSRSQPSSSPSLPSLPSTGAIVRAALGTAKGKVWDPSKGAGSSSLARTR
jgi:hypothetical protein